MDASAYVDEIPVGQKQLVTWIEWRKTAVATLVAINRILKADFPELLRVSSFAAAYSAARELPIQSLHACLGSPAGLLWLRAMRDVLEIEAGAPSTKFITAMGNELGAEVSPRTLSDELGVLAAAAAINCGRNIEFDSAIPVWRKISLPGTGITLLPLSSAATIRAVHERQVVTNDVEVRHSPVLQFDEFSIVVELEDDFLTSDLFEPLVKITASEQVMEFVAGLRGAIALVRDVMPGMYHEVAAGCRVAIPVRPKLENTYPSGTTSTALGLTYLCFDAPSHVMAEMLVHEISHSHLFLLQNQDPLLDPAVHGDGWGKPLVYSPWRDDARPINGLLHACFVFGRVARFWEAIVHFNSDSTLVDFAQRRLSTLAVQLRWGLDMLQKSAKWTNEGERFIDALQRLVASLQIHVTDSEQPLYLSAQRPRIDQGNAEARQEWHYRKWLNAYEVQ